ncbi:unconventional myosin-Ih [Gadus macrocephalus]|uniref:unconventional myosin-Ih n=1 Tax=Gadus macrocephalus TaxID=80720 RepID=UPI0028CB6E13|nr:unconventional myosin-Ih [Gadus macrocephalus]
MEMGLLNTEGALVARDKVGIQDFVLLDETTETAFMENLKKRFDKDLIYTYIGALVVSVNPYKDLDIYNSNQMDLYMGVNFFELPPHIFALADTVYHAMMLELNNHFILISGESGAGKTEASKKILQYYAVCSPETDLLTSVRDKMLMSNPVLEAFGNAKTLKNDNSSRFGKYMDIQFNSEGEALGGHILNYLLEKSRVVHQNHGERNFHIFYQLVEGGEEDLLHQLGLERDCLYYNYLTQGECAIMSSINDKNDWKTVKNALKVIEVSESDRTDLFGVVASVLHLGNVEFDPDSRGNASLNNNTELRWVSTLLGVNAQTLQEGLTYRKIRAQQDQVLSPFTIDHAIYVRDALAKAMYGRTFTWLVRQINESMENKDDTMKMVIGLLDIYGFEVFYVNSFEQFCINYCNEKLQQLFIQLTLKSEQEEYEAEGIEWEAVQFFNNKIICDLVEERHRGIISILDEECLRPGDATDLTFLERLEEKMGDHPHFVTHRLADITTRKTLDRGDFRLLHYAGEVTYCVVGFLDKNNDLLYKNIKDLMGQSKNSIVREVFGNADADSRRRPETVATQFKSSLLKLTESLLAKDAWYVRCLKSNESKKPGNGETHPVHWVLLGSTGFHWVLLGSTGFCWVLLGVMDEALVRHQVKYLGLMEHLRVRRAGFAYRRRYEVFLQRYKALCPATWPHWLGLPMDGVQVLVQHLGYMPYEYKMGRTKIFIRHPKTLYATEDAFERCKHELATKLQGKYRGYKAKGELKKRKENAFQMDVAWKAAQARKEEERRDWAVKVIKKFINGFINRGDARSADNSEYLAFVRQSYLNRLKLKLPKTVLDKTTWLTAPSVCQEASEMLRKIYYRLMVRKYVRGISQQKRGQLQMKVVTSAIFKGKKDSYPQSITRSFLDTRIGEADINPKVLQMIRNERVKYSVPVVKYDRKGFKPRPRQILLTTSAAYLVEEAKIKQRVLYTSLKGISVSNLTDDIVVLHITCEDAKQKGDLVFQCDHLFEFLTKLSMLANKQNAFQVVKGSITIEIQSGKQGAVDFTTGPEPLVYKDKNGHLMVVSTRVRAR